LRALSGWVEKWSGRTRPPVFKVSAINYTISVNKHLASLNS